MSYVIAAPEMLATAAADVDGIGSAIRAASASAAGPTTGLLAAAADEVSSAAAALFSEYARMSRGPKAGCGVPWRVHPGAGCRRGRLCPG